MEQKNSFLVLFLLLLTLGFRIVFLESDPPANFSWSGGYFADEGFWSHNARNNSLFGTPVLDEWDARAVSPVFAFFQDCVFRFLGIGLRQVRLIGIFSSVLISLASFLLFRRQFSPLLSFLFALIISLNFPMMVLGRQGILDPFAAALAWSALALVMSQRKDLAFLAGVLLVGGCITKYLMMFLFVPFGILLLSDCRKVAAPFLLGVGGAAAVWLFGNYFPHQALLNSYSKFYASQQSWEIAQILKNVFLQPFYLYFVKTPAVLFLGNLMLWYFLTQPAQAKGVERVCWTWLLCGILFFALWKYRPLRYYTSLLLPLGALAGMSFLRLDMISRYFRSGRYRVVLWIGVLIPALQSLFILADRLSGSGYIPVQLGISVADAVLFLLLSGFAALLLLRGTNLAWIGTAFLVVFLLSDVRNYLVWMLHPQYAAMEISGDLQARVGAGVLTGQWAPELCLENRVRTVPVWNGFVNSNHPFQKYGITHVLEWQYDLGGEKFGEWYPEEFARFLPIARYRIKDSDLVLYERQ